MPSATMVPEAAPCTSIPAIRSGVVDRSTSPIKWMRDAGRRTIGVDKATLTSPSGLYNGELGMGSRPTHINHHVGYREVDTSDWTGESRGASPRSPMGLRPSPADRDDLLESEGRPRAALTVDVPSSSDHEEGPDGRDHTWVEVCLDETPILALFSGNRYHCSQVPYRTSGRSRGSSSISTGKVSRGHPSGTS